MSSLHASCFAGKGKTFGAKAGIRACFTNSESDISGGASGVWLRYTEGPIFGGYHRRSIHPGGLALGWGGFYVKKLIVSVILTE